MERDKSKLTALNVWAVTFGGVVGWGAFVMPGTMFLRQAGPMGALIAMELAVFVMFVVASNYYAMLRRMPSPAGPYAWTRTAFGERQALICAWFQSLAYLVLVPQNATALAVLSRLLLRITFQTGFHYRFDSHDIYAAEILLSEVAIVIFGLINTRPIRFVARAQTAFVILLGVGLFVMLTGAVFSPEVSAANFYPLFHPGREGALGILSVLAVAPWAFMGFDFIPHLMEDLSPSASASKTPKIIMDMTLLCGGATYGLLILLAASALPEEFSNWVEYIDELPQLHRIVAVPTFYAAWEIFGNFGLAMLGLAALGAIFTGILGFYIVASRLLRALALEGALPAWFGRVNRHNAPANATFFLMGVSLIAPFFGRAALGWLVDMSALGAAIAYGYTSLAARKFAAQEGRGTLLGTLGFVFTAFFALLLLIPGLDSSLGVESYICLALWGLLGLWFARTAGKRGAAGREPQPNSP